MKNTHVNIGPMGAIIGLGNPGASYYYTRHNIGYRVVDELARRFGGTWHNYGILDGATITINEHPILLVKAHSYMNDSGTVVPFIAKKGIRPVELLVVHDELEKPFGTLSFKVGGSHRGHNGLRSIIGVYGDGFARLRVGIGRPARKEDVNEYVLQRFEPVEIDKLEGIINSATTMIEDVYQ
jgi:PTH1 family peptidyl-tRNA hydrolase